MQEALPWLRQGDLFAAIPGPEVETGDVGGAYPLTTHPAILLTHDCTIDKRTASGRPATPVFQFAHLRPVDLLDNGRQERLRQRELNPPNILYVGNTGEGEAYAPLDRMFGVRAEDLSVEILNFEHHDAADPDDPNHLVAGPGWHRVGTLDEADIDLLHRKLVAHFTRARVVYE